jgi:hypothetical protein
MQEFMPVTINRLKGFLCIPLLLFCNGFFVPAQIITKEYQVKATFLYNFTQFVNWPPTAFSSDTDPFVIGVVGEDPFGTFFDEMVAGEKVNGHPLIIQRYKTPEGAGKCQLLFFGAGSTKDLDKFLAELKGHNILTVSDDHEFLQQGGMMRFITRNNKVKIQVNLQAAQSDNLTISSKLLRLVQIFTPSKDK